MLKHGHSTEFSARLSLPHYMQLALRPTLRRFLTAPKIAAKSSMLGLPLGSMRLTPRTTGCVYLRIGNSCERLARAFWNIFLTYQS
jgi:hypothetical protein